jgi:ribosomal protein S16
LHNGAEVLVELGKHDYHYQIGYRSSVFDLFPSVRLVKMLWGGIKKRWAPIFQQNGFYNPKSEAYQVTLKIMDAFYQKVLGNGALPVIVIFPDVNDQWHSRQKKKRRYLPLLHDLQTRNYRFMDALGALQPYESQYTVDDLVERWGHYSALGDQLMAQYILAHLRRWNLANLSQLQEAVQRERRRLGMAPQRLPLR